MAIKNTCDPRWKKYPSTKIKVSINNKIYYMNYKEYWHDFLLCEPFPSIKLHINTCGRNDG